MTQHTGENRPVNGIEHEKQDEIKEYAMFPSGIFDNQTQHHQAYDFVGGVVETRSVINEGVKLHSQVYYGRMHIAMYRPAMAILGLSPRRGYGSSPVTKEFNIHIT